MTFQEYVKERIYDIYFELKGETPRNNSPVFRKILERTLREFDVPIEHISGVKTVKSLIGQIVRHSVSRSSPSEKNVIQESKEFYEDVYG